MQSRTELGLGAIKAGIVEQLEHGAQLASEGHGEDAEPLLAESGAIFDRLGARPWQQRLEQVTSALSLPA